MEKKKSGILLWLIPAVLLFAAGFVAAGLWDLDIDKALHPYGQASVFAAVMEAVGWIPAFLPAILLFMLGITRRGLQKNQWWQPVACGAVLAAGLAVIFYMSYHYMADTERPKVHLAGGLDDARVWVWLVAGVLLAALALWAVARAGRPLRTRLTALAAWGTVYMLANQAAVYLVKTIWARTRFDTMLLEQGGFDAFTPWWQPFGNGGSSFPSGHTANAAGIFILLVLCDIFPAWQRRRGWVLAGCWVYVAAMAVARIMIGRHFLSDTLAAAGIMALLFFAMRRTKPYRKMMAKMREAGEATTHAL